MELFVCKQILLIPSSDSVFDVASFILSFYLQRNTQAAGEEIMRWWISGCALRPLRHS